MGTIRSWFGMAGAMLLFLSLPAAGAPPDDTQTLPPVSGRPVTEEAILPADVLSRVQLLRDEIELLRKEMGRPIIRQVDLPISGAVPREVFFQARTLFQKADRLAFEHTGSMGVEPEAVRADQANPFQVWQVVNAALGRVLAVKKKLGIPEQTREEPAAVETEPSHVFISIVQANRQINLLLESRYAPRDVYQEVSRSIHYAARLLAQYPDAERLPDPPPFERFKQPSDVYQALLGCFEDVRSLAVPKGLTMLQFDREATISEGVSPSDVYDMAVLLVSEMAYLHAQLPGAEPPAPVYDPGRKFPSHVYQRVGILRQQVKTLLHLAGSQE